jgi:hypothetical protein
MCCCWRTAAPLPYSPFCMTADIAQHAGRQMALAQTLAHLVRAQVLQSKARVPLSPYKASWLMIAAVCRMPCCPHQVALDMARTGQLAAVAAERVVTSGTERICQLTAQVGGM